MSILQYSDAINAPDLQVWDNAAFDNEASEGFAAVKGCWQNSDSFQSDCSKENLSPGLVKSPASVKSILSVKPLQPNNVSVKSNGKPLKPSAKLVFLEPASKERNKEEGEEQEDEARADCKIDSEIKEIEREIAILSERLKALRLRKLDENLKINERRGRIIAAKFMDPKQGFKNSDSEKKVEQQTFVSASKIKFSRRGASLGPCEIFSEVGGRRTGVSLGPSEIISGIGVRPPAKIEITPVQQIQNRRKSCFWKLHEIDELKETKERGKRNSMTTSPKWRKTVSKVQTVKQAATTVSSKRPVKKEEGQIGTIQPKKLFKEEEKSMNASAKKPLKNGRVVSSRYSQIPVQTNDGRKRSFPENDKVGGKRLEKKRASSESRVKKRWDIPKEVVMACEEAEEIMPAMGVDEMSEVLPVPRIRTLRCCNESPRDSGPAKRVADLIGRRSFFGANEKENAEEEEEEEEEADPSVCQTLIFEDD